MQYNLHMSDPMSKWVSNNHFFMNGIKSFFNAILLYIKLEIILARIYDVL